MLASRLKSIIQKLVNPCQCGFVPDHQASDNIIVA